FTFPYTTLFRSRLDAFVDHIAAQRQGQSVVFAGPPGAQVFTQDQPFVRKGELAFMNDETHVRPTAANRLENLIERHDDIIEFPGWLAEPELQGQKRARHRAWNGD